MASAAAKIDVGWGAGGGVDGVWGRGSGMRVGAARSVMGRHGEENVGREAAECGVEVTWSVTGQRGKVQVGREVVDDASGCKRGGMMVRDGGRK